MGFSPGERLGPYEILAPLGAGGMGEVYRARDPRLNRDVAIKVSQERFSDRFEREARAVAALNHPNICTLYDVGPNYLVMELIEGESPKGPLPLEEALRIARQIADALEAAHEKGIVHRDLKPTNIKIKPDGTVKVLDFGLAKTAETASGDPQSSPTMTISPTRAGMILGTAAYMSPEQARGKVVDKRADIWAFGVVLYELLTGRTPFHGEDITEIVASVVKEEPRFDQAPVTVRRLLRKCLEKDPKRRLRDIGDVWELLEDAPESTPSLANGDSPAKARDQSRLGVVATPAAAVFAVALAALAFVHFREKPQVADLVRFEIPAPEKTTLFPRSAFLSPDGRRIAFAATGPDGRPAVWIHSLDSLESRPLAGTEGVNGSQFWSPDSRFIAFGVSGKLKKVEASGGPLQTLCDVPGGWGGGAWSHRGVIVFGAAGKGLMKVSEAGGTASPLTTLDSSRQETVHALPSFLPDGRHFVYFRISTAAAQRGIYLGSLDAKPEQQSSKRLLASFSSAAYAPSSDPSLGYLLFAREGSLMAQAFDARRLELAGEAVPIAEDLAAIGQPQFSVSATGILTYRAGSAPNTQLTWFDRAGNVLGTVGEPGQYISLALSPDGTRVAFDRHDPGAGGGGGVMGNADIWLHEFSRGTSAPLTFGPGFDSMPVWSPDGRRIIFASNRDGVINFYQKVSSGAGNEEALPKSKERKYPYDWSQDGRFLLYGVYFTKFALWVLPLTGGDHNPVPYFPAESNASQARYSPDSRWVAYTSDESGKEEVWVRPFPAASGGKWMASRGGGTQPRWRRDGKELFYISADSKMMSVEVAAASGTFQTGIPKTLFPAPIWRGGAASGNEINTTRYDVTADGRKFLINSLSTETGSAPSPPITVVLNWQAGLKK